MKKINENELKEIFEKIKSGDKDAIEILYKNYHNIVYGIAFSILKNKDNSEDVSQEVFAKILKLDSSQFPIQGEASWLYIVTKNETMQFLRKQKKIIDIDDLYSLESESDEISDIVDMTSYYKLIENLKPIDKEIISLRILSDFTFEKIAQMLNMPIGTVEWRYYKSLHYIKLSISNLAAFIIVFTVWKTFSTSEITESEKTDSALVPRDNNTVTQSENFGMSESIHSTDYLDPSITTSAASSRSLPKDVIFFPLCIFFIIFTIFFALKRKIKKNKIFPIK